ncbi:TetR/AcrR family transcriptional regulator [soil metagenome]
MSTRPDPRLARTRVRALGAAYALLLERGVGQVTVDEVSERSGVSKSTLYRHWPSLDELLSAAFSTHALSAAGAGADLPRSLQAYATAIAAGLEQVWGRAAASLAVSAIDDPEQRQAQQMWMRGLREDLQRIVDAAVERGEVVREPDTDRVLERLLAALFHRYLFSQDPLDRRFVTAEVQHALAHLRAP